MSPRNNVEGERNLRIAGDSKDFSDHSGNEEVLREIQRGHGAAEQEPGKGRQRRRSSFTHFYAEERCFHTKTSEAAQGHLSHKKLKKQNLKAKRDEMLKKKNEEKGEANHNGAVNPEEGKRRSGSSEDEKRNAVNARAGGGDHKSRQKNAFVSAVKEALPHLMEAIHHATVHHPDLPSSALEMDATTAPPTASSLSSAASTTTTTATTSPTPCSSAVRCIADLYPRKFERHGHVVVITRLEDGISLETDFTPTIAACFAQSFSTHKKTPHPKTISPKKEEEERQVDVVLYDPVGISGELRQPVLQLLYSDPTSCHQFPLVEAPVWLTKCWTQDAVRVMQEEDAKEEEERKRVELTTMNVNALQAALPKDTVKGDVAEAKGKKEAMVTQNRQNVCVPSLSALRFLIRRYVSSSITFTTHVENKIIYGLDANRVMFSSGNTTERMHFAHVDATGEEVVDMFCGIGYFSLPLAVHGRPRIIHAVDKNPDSVAFLRLNAVWNHVGHVLDPRCGDNRVVGDDWIGQCDRVLMGYLPSCKKHLARAVMLLKSSSIHSSRCDGKGGSKRKVGGKNGARDGAMPSPRSIFTRPQGIIHYHFLAEANNAADILWEDFSEEVGADLLTNSEDDEEIQEEEDAMNGEEACGVLPEEREVLGSNVEGVPPAAISSPTPHDDVKKDSCTVICPTTPTHTSRKVNRFEVLDIRRVKSYSPKVYHYVADVKFS